MKINSHELRLGNYLYDREDRLCIVTKIDEELVDSLSAQGFKAPTVKGPVTGLPNKSIPLTKEFFEAHGEKDENGDFHFQYPCVESLRFYLVTGFIQLTHGFHAPMFNFEHITTVHLFQNLFFFMTGQELIQKK